MPQLALTERERLILERVRRLAQPSTLDIPPLLPFVAKTSPHLIAPTWLGIIAEHMERMSREPLKVCFSTPPQHGKSTLLFHFIAWLLKYFERKPLLYLTYSIDFAISQMRLARPIANAAGVEFTAGSRSMTEWMVANGGSLYATGVGGSVTGRPGGVVLIDDLIKDWEAAQSAKERENADNWLKTVVLTRLHPTSSVAVIATRWHEDDQIGRLVKRGWTEIKLPAIDANGVALWPEGRPVEFLEDQRAQMGSHMFSALYQCDPRPREGRVFQGAHYYEPGSVSFTRYSIGVYLAYSAKTHADYSSAVVLGRGNDNRTYVVDVVRRQCTAPDFAADLSRLQERYPGAPLRWYAAGTEKGAADFLIRDGVRLVVMPPRGDKLARASMVSAAWEREAVLVPHGAPWLAAFINEVLDFTGTGNDAHDDQVDALAAGFDALDTSTSVVAPIRDFNRANPMGGPRTGSRRAALW
jgi:predicted phage terminase large subunit-like protein